MRKEIQDAGRVFITTLTKYDIEEQSEAVINMFATYLMTLRTMGLPDEAVKEVLKTVEDEVLGMCPKKMQMARVLAALKVVLDA